MRENNERNSRKRLNALILLVAFTAVLLIVSTYAWFSTQKNVSLANLDGTVKVAEGLQISLDAKNWSSTIDFSQYKDDQTALKNIYGDVSGKGAHNIIPTEMLPVSTLGSEEIDTANEISFYRGTNTDQIKLSGIKKTALTKSDGASGQVETTAAADPDIYPGYYAIDFFLENSSASTTGDDILQIGAGSTVVVKTGGNNSVGLENTPRVAFALISSDTAKGSVTVGAQNTNQSSIIAATTGENSKIKDVAIWEPNSNSHVEYIVTNNNKVTWSTADKGAYTIENEIFTGTQRIPTYALKSTAVTDGSYDDLYNWDGTTVTSLGKQITLQTDTGDITTKNLLSVATPATTVQPTPSGTPTEFKIPKAQVCRVRMYIWLEGQDVDCINYASHGGGITVNVGLLKDGQVG